MVTTLVTGYFFYFSSLIFIVRLYIFIGFVSIGASSESCENYKNVRVVDTLWYHNMQRGVIILPKQQLTIDKWVTFKNVPSHLNPLYSTAAIDLEAHSDKDIIHILLETNIYPDLQAIENGAKIVSVSSLLVNRSRFALNLINVLICRYRFRS